MPDESDHGHHDEDQHQHADEPLTTGAVLVQVTDDALRRGVQLGEPLTDHRGS
jgi:hypothetical protein